MCKVWTTRYQRRVLRRACWAALDLPENTLVNGLRAALVGGERDAVESLVYRLRDKASSVLGEEVADLGNGGAEWLRVALLLALSTATLQQPLRLPKGPDGLAAEQVARGLLEALGDMTSLVDADGVVDLREAYCVGF